MIDCVGYLVPGAVGHIEDGEPRMVYTPWSEDPMPFEKAAEIGTEKVIRDHSTVGLVVTTDGTVGDIPRENFIGAEKRVINELKTINKPFVVILNTQRPPAMETRQLAEALTHDYGVPVIPVNAFILNETEIRKVLGTLLLEFPTRSVSVNLPPWLMDLDESHPLRMAVLQNLVTAAKNAKIIGEVKSSFSQAVDEKNIASVAVSSIDYGTGNTVIEPILPEGTFFKVLSEESGFRIENERALFNLLKELSKSKGYYDRVAEALAQTEETGYGIVMPSIEDMQLEEPVIVKQPGGYGVKLRASAPSIQMVKTNIQTEVSPIVGSERQSEDIVKFLLKEFEEDPAKIWESNMFGKSLHELVNEGITAKLQHMPEEARTKLGETLEKIINEGSGGLICILL
ncbi:MAG TPA: stage IV sporulation protein A [Clostridiales bacterium]|nr:stage IV sporulation protein A [Clostridiales bacterium]